MKKLRKLIDIYKLILALKGAGLEAGYSPCGESSYILYKFTDGSFVWTFIPDMECDTSIVDKVLIGKDTLAKIMEKK